MDDAVCNIIPLILKQAVMFLNDIPHSFHYLPGKLYLHQLIWIIHFALFFDYIAIFKAIIEDSTLI